VPIYSYIATLSEKTTIKTITMIAYAILVMASHEPQLLIPLTVAKPYPSSPAPTSSSNTHACLDPTPPMYHSATFTTTSQHP
jgi:hypothetical protein